MNIRTVHSAMMRKLAAPQEIGSDWNKENINDEELKKAVVDRPNEPPVEEKPAPGFKERLKTTAHKLFYRPVERTSMIKLPQFVGESEEPRRVTLIHRTEKPTRLGRFMEKTGPFSRVLRWTGPVKDEVEPLGQAAPPPPMR